MKLELAHAMRAAVIGLLLSACAGPSFDQRARVAFTKEYSCAAETVTQLPIDRTAELPTYGYPGFFYHPKILEVRGCGRDVEYSCGSSACLDNDRYLFRATDGSEHHFWSNDLKSTRDAVTEAALASAKHDLPCAAPAKVIASVDTLPNVLEGCGQRVTYQLQSNDSGLDTTYILTGRVAVP